jgi:predicted DNA-binding ribbon-helix-helix protein
MLAKLMMMFDSRLVANADGGTAMKSSIIDRLSVIAGHRPKASLEDAFWDDLGCDETLSQSTTNADRQDGDNLSSASRLFVLGLLRRSQAH